MNQKPVQLIPLLCAGCRAPIPARPDEVAWVCEQCGQGLLLDEAPAPGPGACATLPIDVFFSKAIPQNLNGRPFWVARGTVTINRRETYKGDEARAAAQYWSTPRLFYIPAWTVSLEETLEMGTLLLDQPEAMEPGSRAPFLPVTVSPRDMRALAEFLVVAVEARRRDAMRSIDFHLALDPPQLWVLK